MDTVLWILGIVAGIAAGATAGAFIGADRMKKNIEQKIVNTE